MIWIDGLFVILVFIWLVSCLMTFIVCLGKAGMMIEQDTRRYQLIPGVSLWDAARTGSPSCSGQDDRSMSQSAKVPNLQLHRLVPEADRLLFKKGIMESIHPKLLEAFQQDHALLGRGFNELSCCLRGSDSSGACAAARQLYEQAGAHIGFEEEDFYPALIPLLGKETVQRMYQEHCCGFDAIHSLIGWDPNLLLPAELSERLLAQTEAMEEHIAECGELFSALRRIPIEEQQALYEKLLHWRQHPKLDWKCRTLGCGALRLAQCYPAMAPSGAGERSSLPVIKQFAVGIGADERRELARLAARLIAEEPAFIANNTLDPRTGSGIENGPALFFEDHGEMPLSSGASFGYRARLLAGDGDIVMIGSQRRPPFEAYCRDRLGIGDPSVVTVAGPSHLPLATRCAQDSALLAQISAVARRAGRLGLIPYLGSESAWALASAIAAESGVPVWVAAPAPRLAQRVNDKLWFSDRVTQVLGHRALPSTYYIFGPEALARRVALLAQHHERVCIKVPNGTGGKGNLVLDARQLSRMSITTLRQFLLERLHELGWRKSYPVLAGVWESLVIASPSVQLWIPHPAQGAPIVEGIFEQIIEDGYFVGATPCSLPASECQRLAQEAVCLACLFQELGYFGRCSLDAVLLSSGALKWIECNGRWGGVSIPMTLLNRLNGDWQNRSFVIVQQSGLQMPARGFAEVVDPLQDQLFRPGGRQKGVLFLTADWIEQGSGFHFAVLGDTQAEVLAEAKSIARFLQEDYSCADFMDSGPPK